MFRQIANRFVLQVVYEGKSNGNINLQEDKKCKGGDCVLRKVLWFFTTFDVIQFRKNYR